MKTDHLVLLVTLNIKIKTSAIYFLTWHETLATVYSKPFSGFVCNFCCEILYALLKHEISISFSNKTFKTFLAYISITEFLVACALVITIHTVFFKCFPVVYIKKRHKHVCNNTSLSTAHVWPEQIGNQSGETKHQASRFLSLLLIKWSKGCFHGYGGGAGEEQLWGVYINWISFPYSLCLR